MANFNVNIISGSVEIREGELTLSNSESTINVRTELNKKEVTTNKTLALTSESDHQQYPSAKAVVDYVSASVANIPDAAVIIEGTYSRDSWKIVYDTASLQASEILVESGAYSKGYAAVEADTPVYLHLTRAQSRIAGADPSPSEYFLPLVEYSTDFLNFLGPEGIHVRVSSIDTARADMDYASFISDLWYDSGSKKIYFENPYRVTGSIDATAFIKDGMVDTVTINTGSNQMIITFNTEAGKEDIELNLNDVFNPSNYYTKTDVNNFTGSWTSASNWLGTNSASINTAVGYAHTHSNKAFLDSLTEAQTASWTNASSWVGSNSASIASVASNSHTHDNKALLDDLTEEKTGSWDSAEANVIEAIEFNGTASSVSNKTASISVTLPDAPNQNAENWVTENSASLVTESVWVRGTGTNSAILSGSPSVADAQGAVAHGNNATASGQFSHAEGWRTRANNVIAHAEGSASVASGIAAHAEGRMTTASGYWSHTEGSRSVAFGQASHAEGRGTRAEGTASHAEGWSTTSSGHYSHAEGQATKALGSSSHAEGVETIASGSYSHAEGNLSIAYGNYSHVEGFYTLATNTYELSVGKCNVTASGQIFSVGAGDDGNRRKNAISIITGSGEQSSASIYVYGVGSYVGTNPQPGVNDLATIINDISASGGGPTAETDPIYVADSASLKDAASWVGSNSSSVLTSETDPIYLADSASLKASGSLAKNLTAISASLIASGTLAKNVTAITASLVASASVAKTASSSAAAISAKTGSWDALVGLPTVTAADNGKILRVVNGAWALVDPVTVYSGQNAPDNSLGQNGDIYLQS